MTEANKIENPANNTYQAQVNDSKPQESITVLQENSSNISTQNPPKYIRKKYTFNKFKKIVKKGGYTSARLTAKALGVDYHTILEWTNTPQVMELMRNDVADYTKKIKASKDWKAQAYLLDKVLEQDNKENPTIDLKQMIVINT